MRQNVVNIFSFIILIIGLFSSHYLFSQDKKTELENNKKRIEEEINFTTKLLEETKQNKQVSLNELSLLQSKIRQRENMVATIQKQLMNLEGQLTRSKRELSRQENELAMLKKEYAKMIIFAYKNRSGQNKLMFLFASDDFNQAYRRLKYLQQYAELRQTQISRIALAQEKTAQQKKKLEAEKTEKSTLFELHKREQILLGNEKVTVNKTVQKIAQQEKQLQATLKAKEREAKKLQRDIEAIISEEIKQARMRKGEKTSTADRLMELTPEEQILSNSFTQNRGKLPWPVERGVISSQFGEQPHPVLKKVTIKNNGIDIATTKGSEARAIFEGVVVSTNRITATNNAVIIRHGDYFTVYSNLEEVFVKRGDQVVTKQKIGILHTDKDEGKTELHFEVWQNRTITNPTNWLAR